jgi:hypothetical protein
MRGTKWRGRRTPAGGGRVCLGQWQASLSLTIRSMLVVGIAMIDRCSADKVNVRLVLRIIDRGGRFGERRERHYIFDHDRAPTGHDAMAAQRSQIPRETLGRHAQS